MHIRTHTLVRGLVTGLAATAAALAMLPMQPAQAASSATVSSSPSAGVKFVGTNGPDTIVFTRAGTASAPKIHFDADTPISIQAGCVAVVGDPTRDLCDLPLVNGQVKKISIFGLGGDDLIAHGTGSAIPMVVNAGPGNDTVNGGPGRDEIDGSTGNDVLRGGDNTDTLKGGSGNDTLEGGAGRDDNLFGGDGDDILGGNVFNLFTSLPNADGAVDQIAGEDGNDTCVRSAADPDLTVDCETVGIDG